MKEHAVVDDAGEGSKEDTEDAGQSEEASEESDEDKSKQSSGEDEASEELESSVPGAVAKQEPGASEEDDPFFNPVPNAKSVLRHHPWQNRRVLCPKNCHHHLRLCPRPRVPGTLQ